MGRFKADELESGIASLPDSCFLNRFAAGDEGVQVKPDVSGRTRFNCRMLCILL